MDRSEGIGVKGSEWSLCNLTLRLTTEESPLPLTRVLCRQWCKGVRVWACSAKGVGSLLCEGVLLRVWILCSFLFWYCGSKMVLSVASGETWLNGAQASWARVPISFLNSWCWCQVPRWIKKRGYSSLVSSSTRKSGICLIISQTVFWAQIFPKLMLMGHFSLKKRYLKIVSSKKEKILSSVSSDWDQQCRH